MESRGCCHNVRCTCDQHITGMSLPGINFLRGESVAAFSKAADLPTRHGSPKQPISRVMEIKPLEACMMGSFECRECERVFTAEDQLEKHIKNHEEHRPHKCPRCNKGFKQPSHLSQHLRTHTDERPFPCEVCKKCFKQSCQLKQHMRLHTGEKPYKCPECERGFKQASQLNQHVRLHTGEKPYKCLICTKTFTQASQLRSHKKTHEPKESRKSARKAKLPMEQPLPPLVPKQELSQPQAMHLLLPDRALYFHA